MLMKVKLKGPPFPDAEIDALVKDAGRIVNILTGLARFTSPLLSDWARQHVAHAAPLGTGLSVAVKAILRRGS